MTLNIQSKLVIASMGVAITMTLLWQPVSSHGRLVGPPSRSSMWRYGFGTPINYNDNELFCGGFKRQKSLGYKCGICGDPWDGERHNEAGGIYATGTIAADYTQGQEIVIDVDLTANHKGWFEFKLCPTNDYRVKATQECLDLYPLQLSDGSGTKLYVEDFGNSLISIPVALPSTLSCQFCVLQWHYHAGNSWGTDPDGRQCTGCGLQEEFYGCADVAILSNSEPQTTPERPATSGSDAPVSSSANPIPTATPTSSETPTTLPQTNVPATTSDSSDNGIPRVRRCRAVISMLGLEEWCNTNCHLGYCPPSHCTCESVPESRVRGEVPYIKTCRALMLIPGLQEWCDVNCNLGYCPVTHCACESILEPRASAEANLPPGCYARSPFINWPGIESWCAANCPAGVCEDDKCFCNY